MRYVFIIVFLAFLVCGCARKVFVPVERIIVKVDSVKRSAIRADSVAVSDSVMIFVQGDTVVCREVRDRVRTRVLIDTVERVLCDTVVKSVPATGVPSACATHKKPDTSIIVIMVLAGVSLILNGRRMYGARRN